MRGLRAGAVLSLLWLMLACDSRSRPVGEPAPAAVGQAVGLPAELGSGGPVPLPSPATTGTPRSVAPAAPVEPVGSGLPGGGGQLDTSRLHFAGGERNQDWLLKQLQTATAMKFKPVGSTSTVFKTTLVGPINGAFKASSRERPRGPASEVAAYRVSRCLGMENVPPAVSRQLRVSKLRASLHGDHVGEWSQIRERLGVQEDGVVRGAMIYWIPDLTGFDIDQADGLRRWFGWLSQGGELPPDRRPLAASISTMVLFDYLIGNFDRWSGGNAKGNPTRTSVYVRDHDMAFPPALGEKRHRRLLERVLRVQRVSRSFYARLRGLTPECVELELSRDPAGAADQLLGRRRMRALFDRRQMLVTHIESLARTHGVGEVLFFP